jgi:beta-lactam-binding protein with PASTA domain
MRLRRRRPVQAEAPTEVQTETVEEVGPPGPPVPPPPDRDLWPWLLLLLVLVLGGLAAAYFITRDDDDKKAATTAPVTTVVTTVAPATTATVTKTEQGPRVTLANLLGIPVTTATKRLQRDGLLWRIRRIDSPKPAGIVAGQAPGPGTQLAKGDRVRLDVSKGPPAVAVPSLVGSDRQRAVAALQRLGLKANVVEVPSKEPAGQVVAQNPKAGTRAKPGSAVRLNISNGSPEQPPPATTAPTAPTTTAPATTAPSTTPPPSPSPSPPPSTAQVKIPDVVGLKLRAARRQIRAAGLVTEIKYVPNEQPEGTVVSQSPKPGRTVKRGAHVLVNVSLGPQPKPQVAVPNVVGQDEASARAALENAGFVVDVADVPTTDSAQNGIVIDEQPPGGSTAPRGSEVTIYVGRFSG